MALTMSIPIKDPNTINPDQSVKEGADSGIVVTHLRIRFVGISFKRNGQFDGANVSVEGFVGNVAEKPIYFDSIPIVLSAAQTATVLAAVQAKLNATTKYSGATPVADPA